MLPLLRKEARALGPTALATAGVIALGAAGMRAHVVQSLGSVLSLLGLLIGVATLSAHGIGHEFLDSTLPALLMQPVPRGRVFSAKLAVAAVSVAIVGAIFYAVAASDPRTPLPAPSLYALLLAFGVVAGPLFSMLGRTTLAGSVLTIAAAGGLWVGAGVAASAYFGFDPVTEADALQAIIFRDAVVVGGVTGGVLSWLLFRRLEVFDGHAKTIDIGSWLNRRDSSRATRPGSPGLAFRATLVKELRLQQLSFVLAALFTGGWIAFRLIRPQPSSTLSQTMMTVTYLYFGTLSIVAGSISIADERQLGTSASQQLLPWPGWLLWATKAFVVLAVAGFLGVALPSVLLRASTLPLPYGRGASVLPWGSAVLFVTACAMYVSSYASASVNAVVASVVLVGIAQPVLNWCERAGWAVQLAGGAAPAHYYRYVMEDRYVATAAASVFLLLFAYLNDRRRDRSAAHAIAHAMAVIGVMFIAFLR